MAITELNRPPRAQGLVPSVAKAVGRSARLRAQPEPCRVARRRLLRAAASVAHVTLTWTLTLRLTGQRTSVLATGPLPGTGPHDFGGAASFSASAIGSPSDYTGCFQKTHVRTQENGRGLCEGRERTGTSWSFPVQSHGRCG